MTEWAIKACVYCRQPAVVPLGLTHPRCLVCVTTMKWIHEAHAEAEPMSDEQESEMRARAMTCRVVLH